MNNSNTESVEALAKRMRIRALKMALDCNFNGSHLGGGLSTIEIFASLYGGIIKYNVKEPSDPGRDRLIVSKGHCVLGYYTALNEIGFLSEEELQLFEINGSGIHGHATRALSNGIEFSGGSLGLGLPYAVGVALAGKMKQLPYHVYVIIGDGECNEGSIWESLMSAAHFELDNLSVIIDKNNLQYDDLTEKIMNLGNLKAKLESFGFYTLEVDGHNVKQLLDAFHDKNYLKKPKAIIAHTIKGKGVSFMENNKDWHHSRLTREQYDIAILEQ